MTPDEEKIEEILNNREKFDKYVYCSIYEAIEELEKRKNNKKIDEVLLSVFTVFSVLLYLELAPVL